MGCGVCLRVTKVQKMLKIINWINLFYCHEMNTMACDYHPRKMRYRKRGPCIWTALLQHPFVYQPSLSIGHPVKKPIVGSMGEKIT